MQHADFLGSWQIDRQIDDHLTGETARFEGKAVITAAQGAWRFDEAGTLRLANGAVMTAERRYLWMPVEQGFAIQFDDGRAFHNLRFGQDCTADHWCDPDQYDVSYDFAAWPVWRSVWRVNGPRKDYTLTSDFTK
ncbi:MAG: DUF6314 family protein [Pseudomonadota bacterium]